MRDKPGKKKEQICRSHRFQTGGPRCIVTKVAICEVIEIRVQMCVDIREAIRQVVRQEPFSIKTADVAITGLRVGLKLV